MGYYKEYICFECDCVLVEGKTHFAFETKNANLEIINVPMGKCGNCNEEYIHGKVHEKIDKILKDIEPIKTNEDIIIDFEEYKV